MTGSRTYGDRCGVARALDVVGERWALLVVRELLLGPKRFTDLRSGLDGASANVLSQRLRELERVGIVTRRRLPPPAASHVYELTAQGAQLEPVVLALGHWGATTQPAPTEAGMSIDSHVLALCTFFAPRPDRDLVVTVDLHLDEQAFTAAVADGVLRLTRGSAAAPDATLTAAPATLLALARAETPLSRAVRTGDAMVEGDEDALSRFLTLFSLPSTAPADEEHISATAAVIRRPSAEACSTSMDSRT